MSIRIKRIASFAVLITVLFCFLSNTAYAYEYKVPKKSEFSANAEAEKIEAIANKDSVIQVKISDGEIKLDANAVLELNEKAQNIMKECTDMLAENNLELTRELENTVTVFVNDVNLSDYVGVSINYFDLVKIKDVPNIRIVFGDERIFISLDSEAMNQLVNINRGFSFQLKELSGTYIVRFLDQHSDIISKYPVDIKFSVPAQHNEQTVYLYANNKHENWGGQYNSHTKSIEVMTRYSGEYNVASPSIEITDIDELSDFEQQAIRFMVVRGYFDTEKNKFSPDSLLTRYDFAQSLVRLFFAMDEEAVCDFTDVDKKNYKYVAAAWEKGIVEGFGDGTFRGESNVTAEQVLALASRTINQQNGYVYPERADEYLSYYKGGISEWAVDEVALSIREGIYSRSMGLEFDSYITRKDAAVILYRLFMIINNIPEPIEKTGSQYVTVEQTPSLWNMRNTIIIGGIVVGLNVLVFVFGTVILRKKRKKLS